MLYAGNLNTQSVIKNTPRASKGSSKYGSNIPSNDKFLEGLQLPEYVIATLGPLASYSLAKGTWSSYRTAERLLLMCFKDRGHQLELPCSQEDILIFVSWLIKVRKVKAGTVSTYLAGIRQMHIMKGMPVPEIKTELIKFLLRGMKHKENIAERQGGTAKRLPMTMNMMKLLKEKIRTWHAPMERKLLIWAVSTISFHGAFRSKELLCRLETEFDPDFDMLADDLNVKAAPGENLRYLAVKLKCPKENKTGKAVVVEVFESGGAICPVKAFTRWASMSKPEKGYPLFRDEQGTPLTGRKFNITLRELLESHVNYEKGKFTSHSFRIGLASTLGARGFSDHDIKEAGRWSSNAFEIYMKLPRVKRAGVAREIGKM
jgi:hypothetical protein